MQRELRDFCEEQAISIKKYLKDNFDIIFSDNYRIKHNEIKFIEFVKPISINFTFRNKHLVFSGKVLIVKDEYGKYLAYINPRIIKQMSYNELLEFKSYQNSFEENERIIKHFSNDDEDYKQLSESMLDNYKKIKKRKY